MARGSRDGKIFRSPEKRLVLAQNTLSTDKGMAKGFSDKKFCRLRLFGVRLLDTVDSKKLSILCKGMAEHLRDKKFGRDPLKSARRPSTDKEMARGLRDVYFLNCAEC
jgi:hypothetical protein